MAYFICKVNKAVDFGRESEEKGTPSMMTKAELAETLGIISDPDENKVSIQTNQCTLQQAIIALKLQTFQKREYGSLNPDLWLEFIPWHSLN